jgi:hypothetical protein
MPQQIETAARFVVGERAVTLSEPDRRPVVRCMRHRRDDLVAASQHGGEIAVAETRDLDRSGCAREQLSGSVAVADRTGADARGLYGHLQKGVERDHLVHLAASNVHVVGERVRELRRDRADLTPYAPEVVEQVRSLDRQLRKEPGQRDHVHSAILCTAGACGDAKTGV